MVIPITRAGGSAGPCFLAGWRGLRWSQWVRARRCAEDAGSWKGTQVGNLSRGKGLESSEVESRAAARDPLPTSQCQPCQACSLCPATLPCCRLHSPPALVGSASPVRCLGPPIGFGSAAPAARHPPARLPPSALAARLLPRSADLHHPEICCSRSRTCPWHRQQHPSSLLLRLRAAASTAQPSAASPGAGVPTRGRQWHPSLVLPLRPCHPPGMPRPTG